MKYVLGLIAATVVIMAFAFLWLFSDSEPQAVQVEEDQQFEEPSDQVSADTKMTGFGTMSDLVARGENLQCQITTTQDSQTTEGTFFVADQKVRGNFIVESPDLEGTIVSSMIIVDRTMYVWTTLEGESFGMKSQVQADSDSTMETAEPVSLDERVKYDCKVWESVDNTMFVPPSDVLFQDFSDILQGGMEYGTVYEEGN